MPSSSPAYAKAPATAPPSPAGAYARPPPVQPKSKGRSKGLSRDELSILRTEQVDAVLAETPWRERGPEDAEFWRGQRWRKGYFGGQKRYAKRGGTRREHFANLAAAGYLMPTEHGAVRVGKGQATETIVGMSTKGGVKGGAKKGEGMKSGGKKGGGKKGGGKKGGGLQTGDQIGPRQFFL